MSRARQVSVSLAPRYRRAGVLVGGPKFGSRLLGVSLLIHGFKVEYWAADYIVIEGRGTRCEQKDCEWALSVFEDRQ